MPHDTTTRRGGSTSRYSPRNGTPLTSTANLPPGTGSNSARSPIQVTMRSPESRYANTTSGGAWMSIEVENSAIVALERSAASRFGLGCLLQRGQVGGPEPSQELLHREQSVGAHDEQVTGTLVPFGDQARAAQDSQMKRDGLLGHGDLFGNLADGAGPIADQCQDAPAVTVSQRPQRRVNRFVKRRCTRTSRHRHTIQAKTCTNVN